MGCICDALTIRTAQVIYRAELLQAGQGGEQKKNTYLLSINSSSMLCPNAPFPACSDPALQHLDKRLGGGSPWGAQKAAAQPFSWGSSCPPTHSETPHASYLSWGGSDPGLCCPSTSQHFPHLSSGRAALKGLLEVWRAFIKHPPILLPPVNQSHLCSPAQASPSSSVPSPGSSSGHAGNGSLQTRALRS